MNSVESHDTKSVQISVSFLHIHSKVSKWKQDDNLFTIATENITHRSNLCKEWQMCTLKTMK
jgi:hypothetical protein